MRSSLPLTIAVLFLVPAVHAQFSRTGPEWTTAGMDAQRSRGVPGDVQITPETMQRPGFTLLWKQTFATRAAGLHSLSEPVEVNTFIGYKGFKALSVTGGSNALFAVDYDLGTVYWEKHFDVPQGTPACAAGIAAAPARLTPLVPPPVTGTGAHGGYHSTVSKPGEGVPLKEVARVPAIRPTTPPPAPESTQTAAPANAPAPNGPGIGGANGPGGMPSGSSAATTTGPITGPVRTGPAPGTGLYKGSQPIFAVSSDGVLHAVSQGSAKEIQKPLPFVPPGTGVSDLIDVNDTVYAVTLPSCGPASDAVFAIDVSGPGGTADSWKSQDGRILGAPAFTATGTVVVATAHSIVELEPKTLRVRRTMAAQRGSFTAAPMLFAAQGREMIAVAADDGRILLYAAEGSGDVPASASTPVSGFAATTLATGSDASGARWLLAVDEIQGSGSLHAYTLRTTNGSAALQPAWTSKPMNAPGKPMIINGIVFALATGEDRGKGSDAERIRRSHPAAITALDAATGKELWSSAPGSIPSFVDSSALSFSPGQIYVATHDGTLYAFGFPVPRQ